MWYYSMIKFSIVMKNSSMINKGFFLKKKNQQPKFNQKAKTPIQNFVV